MTSYILGISAFFHDSAAALIRDGTVVAAAQEERFTRKKQDAGYPRKAIQYCLEEVRITEADLQQVVFYERPLTKFDRILESHAAFVPKGFEPFRKAMAQWSTSRLSIEPNIREQLGVGFQGTIHTVDHHFAHASSAFYPSPFEEAAILTLDAVGEWSTSSIGRGDGNEIQLLQRMRFPHSVGMLYSAFTYYTGFKVNSGEYKVMGLAPYGKPKFADLIFEHLVELGEDGSLWMDMDYFSYARGHTMTSPRFHELFGASPRRPESRITQREMDLAASIQHVCEEVVLRAGNHAHNLTGSANLCMAGGVALNCVANGRLLREGPFKSIWIQPAAGDAGGALGAALLHWHQEMGEPRSAQEGDGQVGSLLGPSFSNDEIGLYLDSVGARSRQLTEEELLPEVAQLLAKEKVVGWFSGRMEYGPRALGSRSILGDARSQKMQQVMNLKIKFRESFRPFAPVVLREHASEVFLMSPDEESPYMLFVAPVREELWTDLNRDSAEKMQDPDLTIRVSVPRSRYPAITHVDYSARVQTVDPHRHGRFRRLMDSFYELTGSPVLVNTSFNIRGEPIVATPEDAYRCFMATDMDVLVLENHLLLKDEQPTGHLGDLDRYRQLQPLD